METLNKKKDGYSSRFGLLMVMVGGSVGTGNLWRFPRLVCTYGGAFVIAAVVSLLIIAIPLVMVENFAGRASRHSAPGAFRDLLGSKWTIMGTFATLCYFMMHCNYTVILAWVVRYLFMSITGSYFGVEDKLELFTNVASADWGTAVCWLVPMALVFFCTNRQGFLEKTAKFIVPIMLVILVGLACYSMTQPGAVEGLKYSFGFEFSELLNANIWIQAITQDFWSLGSGTMLCVTLSKYSAKKEDIVVNTNVQGFGDISFAMLGTLVVLPCIFTFAGSTEDALALAQSGNNGLTFVGLTDLFETLPMGRVIGTLFFLSLAFAAFTSIIAVTTVFAGPFIDMGWNRKKCIAGAIFFQVLLGFPSFMNQDILTNQDTTWGFGIFIGGMFSGILAMKFGARRMREKFINPVSDRKITRAFDIKAGYIAPIVSGIVLLVWLKDAIGWDEQWWNPFRTESVGTLLFQWAVGFVAAYFFAKKFNKDTIGVYYDPGKEEFPEIPERIMDEV